MKKEDIERLKELDKNETNGTIQTILLSTDLNKMLFSETLYFLLKVTLGEKQQIWDENQKLTKILKKHGLYKSENLFGD